MNLRVDLILESEQRSASPVTWKSCLRIGYIVGPVLLGLVVVSVVWSVQQLNSKRKQAEEHWTRLEPQYNAALELQKTLQSNLTVRAELERWKSVRLDWAEQLKGVQAVVPLFGIQLTSLTVGSGLDAADAKNVSRIYTMNIRGRARGEDPRGDTEKFVSSLREGPCFSNLIEQVDIVRGSFRPDPEKDAPPNARIFEIACRYKPRKAQ